MNEALELDDLSVFQRLRAQFAVFLTEFIILNSILACVICYAYFFVYPLILMTCGFPLVDNGKRLCFIIVLIYTIYWIMDAQTPYRGGSRVERVMELGLWKWVAQYFSARLIPSEELQQWAKEQGEEVGTNGESVQLPTCHNYLMGYHPHGPRSLGAFLSFGCNALKFSAIFPNIKSHLSAQNLLFNIPFFRDFFLSGGLVSVGENSISYLMTKKEAGMNGNLNVVVVGGVSETLESRPNSYILVLNRRRGFFRIALKTGAQLIPTLGFGETNIYDRVDNPEGSLLRKFQMFTKRILVPPFLFYSKGVLPYRKRITVVVGCPIACQQTLGPTEMEIAYLREQYKQQLTKIFNKYAPLYDPCAEPIRFI